MSAKWIYHPVKFTFFFVQPATTEYLFLESYLYHNDINHLNRFLLFCIFVENSFS